MKTIFKRELSAYFRSPVAYVVIGLFVLVTGLFFWLYNILSGGVYFGTTLNSAVLFLVVFAPVLRCMHTLMVSMKLPLLQLTKPTATLELALSL